MDKDPGFGFLVVVVDYAGARTHAIVRPGKAAAGIAQSRGPDDPSLVFASSALLSEALEAGTCHQSHLSSGHGSLVLPTGQPIYAGAV